jgi:hypothetical protein
VTHAQIDLAPPDLEGVGQKHVGTGQIDACHCRFFTRPDVTGAPWTRRFLWRAGDEPA